MNLLIAALAALRLTRFITTDTLGHWWFVRPARIWATPPHALHGWTLADGRTARPELIVDRVWEDSNPDVEGWKVKLVKGLDCPFCVGFWIGVAVLLSLAIARAVPPLLPLWRLVMGAFALNYVTGHISAKLD